MRARQRDCSPRGCTAPGVFSFMESRDEARSLAAELAAPTRGLVPPGSTSGPGVEIDGGAKAAQIDPNSCLMDKKNPGILFLVLNN